MKKPNYSLLLVALLFSFTSAFGQNDDKGPKADTTKKEKEKQQKLPLKPDRKIHVKTN